jgi:hypothetical protein
VLLETEPDTERRENVSAARFRDTESHTAGVGLRSQDHPITELKKKRESQHSVAAPYFIKV